MCLTISNTVHEPVKNEAGFYRYHATTADKPIAVTKFLEKTFSGGWMTPYQYHRVTFRNGATTIKPTKGRPFEHTRTAWRSYRGDWCPVDVEHGIHAYYHEDAVQREIKHYAAETWDIHPFKAVIPKGAKYFIGLDGDIVSDSVKVFENDKAYERYIAKHGEATTIDTYYEK